MASLRFPQPAGDSWCFRAAPEWERCHVHTVATKTGFTSPSSRIPSARNTKKKKKETTNMKKTTRLGSDGEGAVLIGEHQQHPLAPRGALCSRFILLSTEHTALPQLRGFEKARGRGRGTLPKYNEKGKHKMEREIWPNATGRGGRRRSHGLSFPALCAMRSTEPKHQRQFS